MQGNKAANFWFYFYSHQNVCNFPQCGIHIHEMQFINKWKNFFKSAYSNCSIQRNMLSKIWKIFVICTTIEISIKTSTIFNLLQHSIANTSLRAEQWMHLSPYLCLCRSSSVCLRNSLQTFHYIGQWNVLNSMLRKRIIIGLSAASDTKHYLGLYIMRMNMRNWNVQKGRYSNSFFPN